MMTRRSRIAVQQSLEGIQVNKRSLGSYNGYNVFLVDGSKLRKSVTWDMVKDTSQEYFDDFLDYGINDDFPLVPVGEIWLADELREEERDMLLRVVLRRLTLLDQGLNDHDAYVRSEKYSWHLRHSMFPRMPMNPRKRIYKVIDGVTLWIVDGMDTRCKWLTRFIQGGHHYVYPFIPKNEIWLDDTLDEDEFEPVGIHEYEEMVKMRDLGWPYDKAHNFAEDKEYQYRSSHAAM